jgi:hypothetical protein
VTTPPDGVRLTSLYLDEVTRLGLKAPELLTGTTRSALLPDPCLSRPLFLSHRERETLSANLTHLRSALTGLPDRMFGGDFAAFAVAMGLAPEQVPAVVVSGGSRPTAVARADLHQHAGGFGLLEYNMGSAVAGIESADISRALLRHPVLADFARRHQLGYQDTMRALLGLIFSETDTDPASCPSVAIVDLPAHFAIIGPYLHKVARRWRSAGLDARAGHAGQLAVHDGRVWLRGRPVDIIYRVFILEHLLDPAGRALLNPVLDAAGRGEVQIFTPLDTELYGSKAALALLCDPANRHLFSVSELAAIDAILPWTRLVRPGPVTLADGTTADLMDYALTHAADLVLKPLLRHGGQGVVAGWHPGTSERTWRTALERAARGGYVIQRRVPQVTELFPGDDGGLRSWNVTWGVFTLTSGFDGVWARAFPDDRGQDVARVGTGAFVGSCLSAR